ncbi:hypothetical protein [Hoeflea sp. TYP-13]|uniref:DUF7714 family protein n=1 Tax=Hoeflea sp. TYP-13 TaxID=3230023 RepID=UPI0034C61D2B
MFGFDPSAANVVPSRYRQVALSTGLQSLDPVWLENHFIGREAYMRTRFIVARCGEETALVEIDRRQSSDLFSPIESARVLATPRQCRYVVARETDCGVASQMAAVALDHQDVSCVVVEGRYSHVSFILNPQPLKLHVLDIVPPFPSKLLDQVQRVLDLAEELPPVVVVPTLIDSRAQLTEACDRLPSRVLVPCRGSGIDLEGVTIDYLDERPQAADWTLLGCERSHQIHRWFYGSSPTTVDICPKRFAGDIGREGGHILTRCCLLQEGIEDSSQATFVPWGASLCEVHDAIETIINRVGVTWTPT